MKQPKEIFNEPEAAFYLAIQPRTMRLWRHTRGLPHIKITSKVIRYRKADLDAWLQRHAVAISA